MKLTLHSQLQSGGWILHWSASNHREGCSFDFSPRAHFLSSPDWSLHAGCVLSISQWWLILWAPAKELVISAGDAAASSLSSPLHLVFLKIPPSIIFFSSLLCLTRTLVSHSDVFSTCNLWTFQAAFWGVSPLHVCVQDTKIASLERNIRDLEDEIQMLKANSLLNTEDREEEIKQMEVYKNHSKFMKTKVNAICPASCSHVRWKIALTCCFWGQPDACRLKPFKLNWRVTGIVCFNVRCHQQNVLIGDSLPFFKQSLRHGQH